MSIPVFCALLLTALAAVADLKQQRIPNLMTMGGWIAGAGLWMGFRGLGGIPVWLLGSACLGLAGLLVWRLGGIGGGDVKLLSALGGMLSWKRGLWVFFAALVLAAGVGTIRLLRQGRISLLRPGLKQAFHRLIGSTSAKDSEELTKICFAVMLFLAVILRAVREWWWLH